ncbi:YceI family protein [Paludibaculum fermentans]|uniref:YceI family protein n=1 Tax=Paludibaculum fermentans TaxID=1473598 RepID=A0A7S7SII1_PALFE|nr:YceI family protein [Paludibaculum fermentans]QOY85491.1 YceI family protein [Paludibaculum fermentans]
MRYLLSLPLLAAGLILPLHAADTVLVFDPPQTQIHWTLDTLVHTVHGTFQLRSGTVRFDPATGNASGELIVDARTGASGNDSRDGRMHKSILESAKFPDVVFKPKHVDGQVPAQGSATLQVHGSFLLHGSEHEATLPIQVSVEPGHIGADSKFSIPYVAWGLKNPSTFVLRVNEKVDLEIHAAARIVTNGVQ